MARIPGREKIEGNEWGGSEKFPPVEVKINFPSKTFYCGRYGWGI